MANEITVQLQLKLNNGDLADAHTTGAIRLDQTTAACYRNVQEIGFAAEEALTMGGITTPGFAVFQNLDPTNFVLIGEKTGGTFYPFMKLKPGEQSLCRLAALDQLTAQADTGAVDLFYIIYDD